MSRRRRKGEEEPEVEPKEGETEAVEEENGSSGASDKLERKINELEEKNEDLMNKLGMVLMDARDADQKVKKLMEKFKDIEELADELDEKLEKISDTENRLNDITTSSQEISSLVARLEESLNAQNQSIEAQQQALADQGQMLSAQEQTLAAQEQALSGQGQNLNDRLAEIAGALEEIGRTKEDVARLSEMLGNLGSRFDEVQASGGASTADVDARMGDMDRDLKESIQAVRDLVEGHRAEIAPLIEKMGESTFAEVARVSESVRILEERLGALSDSIGHDVAEKLEALSRGASSDELSTRIGEVNERIAAMEQDAGSKARELEDINEELNQIDERYSDVVAKQDELLEKMREDFRKAIEDSEARTREVFGKMQSVMDDSQGISRVIEETGKKAVEIEEKIQAAVSRYDDMAARMNDLVAKSEGNMDKVNSALKMVDEVEVKVKKILAPVDDALGDMEMFEKLPDIGELGFDLNDLIQVMIKHQASDLHLKEGSPPTVRLEGDLVPVGNQVLTADECRYLVFSAMSPSQRRKLREKREMDFAYASPEARFRVNAFLQKGSISASFRMLKSEIPSLEDLGLPPFLKKLCGVNHGLILVTGPAGSGKSTTLASMIDYINTNRKLHIVTIEDPIEFIHQDKMSMVTQREVGSDTPSFAEAMRSALRQDPNVILIGEMRDAETIMTAAMAAETGHLVLSTLHTPNAIQAVDRVLDAFTGEQQKQFRMLLASTLRSVISQRLLNRMDGEGRVPATEILVVTPTVSNLILEKKTQDIYPLMVQGATEGMQTFTASLTRLLEGGLISKEDAIYQSDRPNEFRLGVEGHTTGASAVPDDSLMSWL